MAKEWTWSPKSKQRGICVGIVSSLIFAISADPLVFALSQTVRGSGNGEPVTRAETQLASYLFGNPKDKQDFTIWVTSSRPGLTFADGEPLDVRLRGGGTAEATTVEYTVREAEGPWQAHGTLVLEKGTVEKPLPIAVPGRGLFRITLSAQSGTASSTAETWLAVVFPPLKTSPASTWGVVAAPQDYDLQDPNGARDAALAKRMLGASWARFIYPYPAFDDAKFVIGPDATSNISVDVTDQIKYAQALRDQGIFIMGDAHYMPRAFSSKPDDRRVSADSGPAFSIVPPRDNELWERFMETLATKYRGLIRVWQIGNEPDLPELFWRGTPEQFMEFVRHSAAGLRRGDPSARIAAAGFTGGAIGYGYAQKLFQLGLGKYLDILTVHYTDEHPDEIDSWKNLVKEQKLQIPIWNSEEKSAIPINNIVGGQGPFMKFLHVDFGYPEYDNLVRQDLTVRPPGIAFSVGAKCLGDAKWIRNNGRLVPGWQADFFQRANEKILVLRRIKLPPQLLDQGATHLTLEVDPVAGEPVTATDVWGHSRVLTIQAGRAELGLAADLIFVNGARRLEIGKVDVAPQSQTTVVEAESGRWSNGWTVSDYRGYSNNKLLEISSDAEPGPEGLWAELRFRLPTRGRFDLIFAGTSLEGLLAGHAELSPFAWTVDDGAEHVVDTPLPVIRNVAGAPQGFSVLETLDLNAGEHTFRLRLIGKREAPNPRWSLWFDAIAIRATAR